MERELLRALQEIEAGYEGAQLRAWLRSNGLWSAGDFRRWLEKQPKHLQQSYRDKVAAGKKFLGERNEEECDAVYTDQVDRLLRSDIGALWALSVIEHRHPLPADDRLLDLVLWVGEYISA